MVHILRIGCLKYGISILLVEISGLYEYELDFDLWIYYMYIIDIFDKDLFISQGNQVRYSCDPTWAF